MTGKRSLGESIFFRTSAVLMLMLVVFGRNRGLSPFTLTAKHRATDVRKASPGPGNEHLDAGLPQLSFDWRGWRTGSQRLGGLATTTRQGQGDAIPQRHQRHRDRKRLDDAAESGDRELIAEAFAATGGACKACHDEYKSKDYLY